MKNINKFKQIHICEWRQFHEIKIDFHDRLTILTGPNGSGKSTILSLLGNSVSDDIQDKFLATPVHDKKSNNFLFSLSTLFRKYNPFLTQSDISDGSQHSIGHLLYANGNNANLLVPTRSAITYQVTFNKKKTLAGFRVGSHSTFPSYQRVRSIPMSGISPAEAFRYFNDVQRGVETGRLFHTSEGRAVYNPIAPLKEALIGFAAFGSSNPNMRAVPELVGLFEEFQEKLLTTLPPEVGFKSLEVRASELVVVSSTGEFPIDGASGGLMALIQITWQIFLFVKVRQTDPVVLIDEPENHLHPSLQRDFLTKLIIAFPDVQFIIATHSPFIVTSARSSHIYALQFHQLPSSSLEHTKSGVTSTRIDLRRRASSATDVLATVLGVSVTIPIWAESELTKIIDEFSASTLSVESIQTLKDRLSDSGLEQFFPEAIARLPR